MIRLNGACEQVDCLEHTINRLTWATNPMTILDLVVLAVFYLDLVSRGSFFSQTRTLRRGLTRQRV